MGLLTFSRFWMERGSSLDLGSELPSISIKDQDGVLINLASLAETNWLLIYFYPKADTYGCTLQSSGLRDIFEELKRHEVKVVGVSADACVVQQAFRKKLKLPFLLLADTDREMMRAFGVTLVPVLKWATRQSFLFQKGKLKWRDLSVSVREHASNVLRIIAANV